MDWGHHFEFKNELGYDIDSINIFIGDKGNWIYNDPYKNGLLEGNLVVPKNGYPQKVRITIYSKDKIIILNADSFNCHNCDGNHEYILKESGAEYRFEN